MSASTVTFIIIVYMFVFFFISPFPFSTGTFIAEGPKGSKQLHEVLESTEMVDNVVDAMVKLCKHYQFDGWLVNIECKVIPQFMENLL